MGTLARAQKRSPVKICALFFAGNHFHCLLDVANAKQLTEFMQYASSNLAREVARITGWKQKIWGRRYQGIICTAEEEAQTSRLAYILRHGAKERLVSSPRLWPSVHCIDALITGEPLRGYWFDRTKEGAAKRRGEAFSRYDFATPETIVLSPLPCWRHLSPEAYRHRIADLVRQIEADAERKQRLGGWEPQGADGVKAQNPLEAPARSKKSPAPDFHAATKTALQALREEYREFVTEYRQASAKYLAGDRLVPFPAGSFPPPMPYVE
ncbi:MAG: hypothetical protein HC897_00730 [Thermoanaerobaculia bacterium]|nr:hypothetical protein [Thermoanaerobaculia bacterium]